MSQDQLHSAIIEVERRLAGQRATIDQLVGTLLEVIGPDHPIALDIRNELTRINLESLLHSFVIGEAAFIPAGTTLPPTPLHLLDRPPLGHDAQSAVKPMTPKEAAGAPERIIEGLIRKQYDDLPKHRIVPVRDMAINGSEFCDRAVLLELEGGKWALLLSEEYKTVGSGGINPQVAIRDNRLFNDKISGDSVLTFYTGVHTEPVQIKLSDLLINVNTTTTDKFGLKAAGRTRYQQRCLRVTRAIRERKKTYGESVRLGANANVSYFFIGLKYPSKALRALMESLRRG